MPRRSGCRTWFTLLNEHTAAGKDLFTQRSTSGRSGTVLTLSYPRFLIDAAGISSHKTTSRSDVYRRTVSIMISIKRFLEQHRGKDARPNDDILQAALQMGRLLLD